MGIHNDWNDFKQPLEQATKNVLNDIHDSVEDRRDKQLEKEIDRSRQTNCEDFYRYINNSQDKCYGINKNSPSVAVKTKHGYRTFTFGSLGFRVQDSNPLEALYVFYFCLDGAPTSVSSFTRSEKKFGLIVSAIFGALGLIFSKIFFLGTVVFLSGVLFPLPRVDISFPLRDDQTGEYLCTYYLQRVPGEDQNKLLDYLDYGLGLAIKHNKSCIKKTPDQDLQIELEYLIQLQTALRNI